MALQKIWADGAKGITIENAYYRIDSIAVDTKRMVASVRVSTYKDKPASDAGKAPLDGGMDLTMQDQPAVAAVMDGETVITLAIPAKPHFTSYLAGVVPAADETILSAARRRVYEFLKTERPEFAGAVDV